MINDKSVLDYFRACVDDGGEPKTVVKWIAGPIVAFMTQNYKAIDALAFDRSVFMDFIHLAQGGTLRDAQLKVVMDEMLLSGAAPADIVRLK